MSAPRILKTPAPKGAIVVNAYSPAVNTETQIVIRKPWNRRVQLRRLRNIARTLQAVSDLEIVISTV